MIRRTWFILAQIIVVLVVAALIFDLPLLLQGFLGNESFFQGKPTTYWKHQIQGRGRDHQAAVAAFQKGGSKGIEVLIEILQTGTETQRQGAIAVLRGMGPAAKSAVPALQVMLDDRDPRTRIQAAEAVFEISQDAEDVVPVLILALHDERDEICQEAASAITRLGPAASAAVPPLIAALRDENPRVRGWAVAALGKLGATAADAIPSLEDACKDENPGVAAAAVTAIRAIRSSGAPEGLSPLQLP